MATERSFTDGDVTCVCGETFHLWWNGGELDSHRCTCGRYYFTEHRDTVLVSLELGELQEGTK